MFSQPEMLRKETKEFVRWSIVCKLMWLNSLVLQHHIKELTAMSTSLHIGINVEIENRKRFHFDNFTSSIAYEELLKSYFEEADTFVGF